MFLSQTTYMKGSLAGPKMLEASHLLIPVAIKPATQNDEHVINVNLTFTRPDITYDVNCEWQHYRQQTIAHLQAVKHVLCDVKETVDHGI